MASAIRMGSSPHTRGAQRVPRIAVEHHWIIPAYAGSTLSRTKWGTPRRGSSPHTRGALTCGSSSVVVSRDHPRIRGEHESGNLNRLEVARIIPAYAGSTQVEPYGCILYAGSSPHTRGAPRRARKRRNGRWDHPRIRGEHVVYRCVKLGEKGIIPAYAGSTDRRFVRFWKRLGSSPHTRGAL